MEMACTHLVAGFRAAQGVCVCVCFYGCSRVKGGGDVGMGCAHMCGSCRVCPSPSHSLPMPLLADLEAAMADAISEFEEEQGEGEGEGQGWADVEAASAVDAATGEAQGEG